jgi:hypothetical protein
MKTSELTKVLSFAVSHDFQGEASDLSANLADRIHNGPAYCTYATLEEVAALFLWQGMQLNGEWDMGMVNECLDWVRYRVKIIEIPAPPVRVTDQTHRGELIEV